MKKAAVYGPGGASTLHLPLAFNWPCGASPMADRIGSLTLDLNRGDRRSVPSYLNQAGSHDRRDEVPMNLQKLQCKSERNGGNGA
jgi:hypothetical protein